MDGQREAGEALLKLGARAALIKGGHLEGAQVIDVLVTRNGMRIFSRPRIQTRHNARHGLYAGQRHCRFGCAGRAAGQGGGGGRRLSARGDKARARLRLRGRAASIMAGRWQAPAGQAGRRTLRPAARAPAPVA